MVMFATCSFCGKCSVFSRSTADYSRLCCRAPTPAARARTIALIAATNLIGDGLHKMRQLAADPALRSSITTDAAVDECLFAPPTVERQAKTSGEVGGCRFRKGSLFILELGSASKGA